MHQMELWDNFIVQPDVVFNYIYTTVESKGKRYEDQRRDYCIYSKNIDNIESFLESQDIIIVSLGSVEDNRINKYISGKSNLIIYSEHISRKIDVSSIYKKIKYNIRHHLKHPKYYRDISRNNIVLCASSHAGYDFYITGFKKHNIYKFGYFPNYKYNDGQLINNNTILFSGRNIYWKHFEDSLFALQYINSYGYRYVLNVVGSGFDKVIENVNYYGEIDREKLMTFLSYNELFIFPSTREEGWGVVLAEAMAAGCFIIANINAGSTRYLVRDGFNGFTYKNRKQLVKKLNKYLELSIDQRNKIRQNAIHTIKKTWNSKVAAERLYELCYSKLNNKKVTRYKEGPISKDPCTLT